ncbi:lysylphosphatidylglycerol synthase transmembrane domain-containing protein [Cellulomonas sp. PhB150]|uniref:lysylphosphatidylglycerol synthase transmembrane domain-containing protein n=1 Tax=Cellulomonas sp. PhB150 TaxID=2485188 RepID=UPI000F4695C5|nr:lysylphosphatidylglycerol synthase transmembrane domain-containing protein [Cellulomonas sp. PhB150]ROS31330.1 undecaprenyl-diphosphatase [Cellulomonas sp. PhB150]
MSPETTAADAGVDLPAPPYRDVNHRHSRADARTAAVFLAIVLVGLSFATVAAETMTGISEDTQNGIERVPQALLLVVLVLVQVTYLAVLLVTPVVLLFRRRFNLIARGAAALLLGPLLFRLLSLIPGVRASGDALAGISDKLPDAVTVEWPSTGAVAACAALAAATAQGLSRPWRRAVWGFLAALGLLRVLTATSAPLDVVLAVGAGGLVGSVMVLLLGRRASVLTAAGVSAALRQSGLATSAVRRDPDAPPGRYEASAPTGPIDVKVLDEHDWRTARLDQTYRWLRWRDVGDDVLAPTPSQAVAAEAMSGLLAASRGVHVPTVRAVTQAPHGESVLAVDRVAGRALSDLPADELTDDVLRRAWQELALLRTARIAHRHLDLSRVLLDADGRIWITGLDRSLPGAGDRILAWDVAELLAGTSARVGPERAVAAARGQVPDGDLVAALPRLVPSALSAPTRVALKDAPSGAAELVDEVCRVTGVEEPQLEKVERFKPRTLLTAAALGLAVYFLAPQLTDLPSTITALGGANWSWVPVLLLASVATYVGAALGLAGGTPGRIPVPEAAGVALASSFVATFAPPGVGQVGLNIRYLQKRGLPTAVAVSASAAKETAVLAVHLLLLVAFAVLAGSTGAISGELDKLPPAGVVAAFVGIALVLVGAAIALPRVRRVVRERVVPSLRASADAMREVFSSPVKIVTLFLGVALLPLGYALCLYFSVRALGQDTSFVAVVLVSLTAGTVAAAAPTPGGIGAVEAVLLASLTGLGIASAPALAAVVLYRLATFWLPIAPGAWAFRSLTARGVL